MIKNYGSVADLCDAYIAMGGNRDSPQVRLGRQGDISLVPLAEEQIREIEHQIETPRMGWERAPAGAFCSVPDVLAGLPTPMRRRTHIPDEFAPITVIVGTASSGGIRHDVFKRRGVTIVALVMALARVRPISLYIMDPSIGHDETGETVIMARVNTTPLDLATACHVLTDIDFTRAVMYHIEEKITGSVSWPRGYTNDPQGYYDGLCDRMGLLLKDTLIIRDAFLGDLLVTQPIVWLNEQIKRFTETNVEEVL